MVTYKIVNWTAEGTYPAQGGAGWYVIVKESGVVVCGPHTHNMALAEANLRASQAPGNRVESGDNDLVYATDPDGSLSVPMYKVWRPS